MVMAPMAMHFSITHILVILVDFVVFALFIDVIYYLHSQQEGWINVLIKPHSCCAHQYKFALFASEATRPFLKTV
jgi:hypothetical protein